MATPAKGLEAKVRELDSLSPAAVAPLASGTVSAVKQLQERLRTGGRGFNVLTRDAMNSFLRATVGHSTDEPGSRETDWIQHTRKLKELFFSEAQVLMDRIDLLSKVFVHSEVAIT